MVFHFTKATGDGGCKCCATCKDPYDVVCYSARTGKVLRCQYHGHGGHNTNAGMDISAFYSVTRISVSDYSVIVASMSSLSIAGVNDSGEAIPIQKGIGGEPYWVASSRLGYQGPFVPSPDGTWPENVGDPYFLQSDEQFRFRFRCSRSPMGDDSWWIAFSQVTRISDQRSGGFHRMRDYVGYVSLTNPTIQTAYYKGALQLPAVVVEYADDEKAYAIRTNWRDDNTPRTVEEIYEHIPEEIATIDFGSGTQGQLNSPVAIIHTTVAQNWTRWTYYNDLRRAVDGAEINPSFEGGSIPVRCNMYPKHIEFYSNIKAMYSGFMDRRGIVTSPRQHWKSYPFYGYLYDCRFAMLCQPYIHSDAGSDYFWAGSGEYESNGVRNIGPIYCGGWIIGKPVISGSAATSYSFGEDCGQQEAYFRTEDLPYFVWPNDGSRLYRTVRNIRGPFCVQRNQGENANRNYLYAANVSSTLTKSWTWWNGNTPPTASDPVQSRRGCVGSCKLTIIDLDDIVDGNGDAAFDASSSDRYYMPLPRLLKEFTNPFGSMTYNSSTVNFIPQDIYAETGTNEDDEPESYIYALLADENDPFQWRRICKYKVGLIGLELLLTITPEHDWQVFHSFAVKNGEIWAAVSASDESVFELPTTLYPPLHEDDIPAGERFSNYGQTYP